MKAFFSSRGFKVIITILAALITISVIFAAIGKAMSPQSSLLSAVTVPIQRLADSVSGSIYDLFSAQDRLRSLEDENNRLRQQIREQNENLIDFDTYKYENEFLRSFLELKEKNPDFSFVTARLSAVDTASDYYSFTINRGTADGVKAHDPVITADGLVGYIGEVGLATSKVYTILDPRLNVGAMDSRTRDTGVINGTQELAAQGFCKMSYLSRSSSISVGDFVITSGVGGMFPDGINIGTITAVTQETADISVFATVKPAVDFTDITDVMIITDFEGRGNVLE